MNKRRRTEFSEFTLDPSTSLFETNLIGPSTVSSDWVEVQPLASLKKGQPVSFDIPASSDLFIHPSIYVKVTFKITNADGSGIGQDISVAPINNSLHTLTMAAR